MWPGMEPPGPHLLSHFARNRGSSIVPTLHYAALPRVSAAGTRCSDGFLRYSRPSRTGSRPDARWLPRDVRGLAVDLLHQCSHRHRRLYPGLYLLARGQATERHDVRLLRFHLCCDWPGACSLCPLFRQHRRLGFHNSHRLPYRRATFPGHLCRC